MKSTTHRMAEAITLALGPIFHAQPDYKTICEAMALTVARVAQSTPDKGNEEEELEVIMQIAANALNVFLNEEKAIQESKAKVLAKGIDGFAEMYGVKGYDPAFEVTHEEFYRNSGLDPKLYEFDDGLAAINGGVSPEACAEAEEFAGKDHAEVERPALRPYRDEEGNITPEGHVQLKKDILALHTPDPERVGWANSPIHEEVARFERENPNVGPDKDPDYHPDGPRAYL